MEIFRTFGSVFLEGADETTKSLDNIDDKANSTGSSLGELGKTAINAGKIMATAITTAATAVVGLAIKTASSMDKIDKESQKLGLSAEAYQEWDFILSQNGASIDSLGRGVTTMTKIIDEASNGTEKATNTFDRLGISVDELEGLSREDMFQKMVTSLQGVESETERATLATEVFGAGVSRELMPLLNAGADSVDELKGKAAELGLVMSDDLVKSGAGFMDTLDQLKRTAMATLFEALAPFLPVIQDLIEELVQILPPLMGFIRPLVEKLMPVIKTIIDTLLPVFIRILNSLIPVLDPIIDLFLLLVDKALIPFIELVARLIDKLLPPVITLFDALMIGLAPIITLFEGIFAALEPLMMESLDVLIDDILPVFMEMFDVIGKEVLPIVIETILELIQALMPLLPPLIELIQLVLPILIKLFTEVIKFVMPMMIKLMQFFMPVIDGVVKALVWLVDAVNGFIKSAKAAFPDFLKYIKDIPNKILGFFSGIGGKMKDVGKNIVTGIWDGIKNMSKWLTDKLGEFAKKIIPAPIAKALGINSPSKLFAGFGENITQGLAIGMEKAKNLVEDASDTLAQAATFGAGVKPAFATATTQQIYTSNRRIDVPIYLNGREIARASARDMDEELANIAKR